MSGIEILGLIKTIINTTDFCITAYNAIKDVKGLPEAFTHVKERLPLAVQTLQDAQSQGMNVQSGDEADAVMKLLTSCNGKVDKLRDIFLKLAKNAKDKSPLAVYKNAVIKLGKKDRVEVLMNDILKDIQTLAAHQVFKAATQGHVEELAKACKELAEVPPSLPDSEFEENQGSATQMGDNNHQYNNFGGGDQNNVTGGYYRFGDGNMTFNGGLPLAPAASNDPVGGKA